MHSSARTRAVVILFHGGGAVQRAVAFVATGRQRPRHCSPINIQPASQAAVLPCLHEAQTGLGNGGELGGNHCKNGSNSGSVTSCHAERNGRGGEIRTHDLLYPKQARYQATLRPEPNVRAEGAHSLVQLQPCFLSSFFRRKMPPESPSLTWTDPRGVENNFDNKPRLRFLGDARCQQQHD